MSNKHALLAFSLSLTAANPTIAAPSAPSDALLQPEPIYQEPPVDANPRSASVVETPKTTSLPERIWIHTVAPGDTLYGIGLRYGVNHIALARFNANPRSRYLKIGALIKIPLHVERRSIQRDATSLAQLAQTCGTTQELLAAWNPKLQQWEKLADEEEIEIPVAAKPARAARPTAAKAPRYAVVAETETTLTFEADEQQPEEEAAEIEIEIEEEDNEEEESSSSNSVTFSWPVQGKVTSNFGWRWGNMHKGIDIANVEGERALIRSAKKGTVVRAGSAGSYGNLVVVSHGKSFSTYYAHLSRIHVSKGQEVEEGTLLGWMGKTGHATGTHLHFEILHNGRAVDPNLHLLRVNQKG